MEVNNEHASKKETKRSKKKTIVNRTEARHLCNIIAQTGDNFTELHWIQRKSANDSSCWLAETRLSDEESEKKNWRKEEKK